MPRTRRFEAVVVAIALLIGAPYAAAELGSADPLALEEFDKEITLKLPAADIVSLFRTISARTRVPFVLELDPDPRLKTDFTTEQTPARAVLVSLASTHGLEYLASAQGVVVRRKVWQVNVPVGSDGKPRLGEAIALRAVPPAGGRQIEIELQVRGADGRVMSTPRVTTQMGQAMEMKQGVEQGNRRPSIALKLTPIKESAEGLECEMEATVSRSVSPTRWIEDHRKESVTAGKNETVLVTTDDGIQVVLTRWQRTTP